MARLRRPRARLLLPAPPSAALAGTGRPLVRRFLVLAPPSAARARLRRPRARLLLVALVALVAGSLAACTSAEQPSTPVGTPATSVPVPLTVDPALAQPITISVLAPDAGLGAAFRQVIEGARIAQYRFALGGAQIHLVFASYTDGDSDQLSTAVATLLAAHPAGLVVTSAGDALTTVLTAARQASLPVLLPYDRPAAVGDGVWLTGPSGAAIDQRIATALAERGVLAPYLLTTGRDSLTQLKPVRQLVIGSDFAALADQVAEAIRAGQADSVVIAAPALIEAALTVDLQSRFGVLQPPIVLTPDALSPVFGQAIADAGVGNGIFATVGPDNSEARALSGGPAGDQAAAFFSAVRLAAADPACSTLTTEPSCATIAPLADIPSHDAVVALVRAVEKAQSTDPGRVGAALAQLSLSQGDGLAGPALDFTSPTALSDTAVTTLYATTQDSGLRPTASSGKGPGLYWLRSLA